MLCSERCENLQVATAVRDIMVRTVVQSAHCHATYLKVQAGILKTLRAYRIGAQTGAKHTALGPSLTSGPALATNGIGLIVCNLPNLEKRPNPNSDDLRVEVTSRTTILPRKDILLSIIQMLLDLGHLNDAALIMQLLAVVGDAVTAKVATSFMTKEHSTPTF